jgi:GAF domain-containing protein
MMGENVGDTVPDVHQAIGELARSMHHTMDDLSLTPDDVLEEVTTSAVRLLPAVAHAGVSLVTRSAGGRNGIESVAATGDAPKMIDAFQADLGEGPGLQAIYEQQTVRVDNYETEGRWPQFAQVVVERSPVRSSLSIQLYTDERGLGSLNLYCDTANGFDADTVEQALALAAHAAVGLSGARRSEQFRSALASRDIIGQAKGMIMERYSINALQAFRLLRRLSQDSNVAVAELARQLVAADAPDNPDN